MPLATVSQQIISASIVRSMQTLQYPFFFAHLVLQMLSTQFERVNKVFYVFHQCMCVCMCLCIRVGVCVCVCAYV